MGVLIQFPARPAAGPAPEASTPYALTRGAEVRPARSEGKLYDRNLSIKEIAKLMRAALKAEIPGVKFSVRKRSSTYSWAIDVEIVAAPFPLRIVPAPSSELQGFVNYWTPEALALQQQAQEIHDRWNYDNCDSMTDYFDVNYYGRVSFAYGAT